MEFEGFDWDAGNIAKCQKHGLSLVEIESLFSAPSLILNDETHSGVEGRFRAIGVHPTGAAPSSSLTWRGDKLRLISARYMHRREIDRYETDNPYVPDR